MERVCDYENCNEYPTRNNPGEDDNIRCRNHQESSMVWIFHNKCIHPKCETKPGFNYDFTNWKIGKIIGIYCKSHKKEGMVNVVSGRCTEYECKVRPYFNNPGESHGIYCNLHKKDGMERSCNSGHI